MTQPKEQWEEEFERKWYEEWMLSGCSSYEGKPDIDLVRDFIHSTRQEALKEGFELCKERVREGLPSFRTAANPYVEMSLYEKRKMLVSYGYSEALSEVKTLIDNLEI